MMKYLFHDVKLLVSNLSALNNNIERQGENIIKVNDTSCTHITAVAIIPLYLLYFYALFRLIWALSNTWKETRNVSAQAALGLHSLDSPNRSRAKKSN